MQINIFLFIRASVRINLKRRKSISLLTSLGAKGSEDLEKQPILQDTKTTKCFYRAFITWM